MTWQNVTKIIIVKNLKPKHEDDKATTSAKHIQEENLQIRYWDNHKKEETRIWEKTEKLFKVIFTKELDSVRLHIIVWFHLLVSKCM